MQRGTQNQNTKIIYNKKLMSRYLKTQKRLNVNTIKFVKNAIIHLNTGKSIPFYK